MLKFPAIIGSRVATAFKGLVRLIPEKVLDMPRNVKQVFLLSLDMLYVAGAMFGAVALRWGHLNFTLGPIEYACALATLLVSAVIFLRLGLYRAVIRFMGQQAIWAIITAASYSALILGATFFFTRADVPRSTPFIYWGLLLVFLGGTRLVVRAYYQSKMRSNSEKVIIYGAGQSGRQLLQALHHGDQYRPVLFVDDDPKQQRSVINGLRVAPPDDLPALIQQHDISQVLLAIPSASSERRREIIDSLVGLQVHVRTVPTINELLAGQASVNQIRDIALDDLLGREPVPPHPELIERCITGKVVMVTGAGGSIGSELCRQIATFEPAQLYMLD
ncbi:MAG: polysaccharide biosynthesis protein, partial [Halioglobus sp.]|nr:polysaccharide biosynthesis protein [Halioglobus sp.]